MMADNDRRKRRRLAKSCEQCRNRKVRCDRNEPCGPCTRARGSVSCSYRSATQPTSSSVDVIQQISQPNLHHKGPGNHPTPTSNADTEPGSLRETTQTAKSQTAHCASLDDIQLRLQHVEGLASRRNNPAWNRDVSLDEALRDLSNRVHGIEQRLAEGSFEVTKETDKDGLCISAARPRLHASSSKMKLLGPNHYSNTVDKLQITHILHSKEPDSSFQHLNADLLARIKECRGVRHSVKARQSFQPNEPVPDLQGSVPAREICDELVDGYLRTFEPIYRILHLPSFWREYHHFWSQRHSSQPISPAFLMKLVLILAIGTVFHPQRGKSGSDHDIHLTQTWIHSAQWWLIGPSEKATLGLDGVQVFCLLLIARQINAMGSSPWLSVGSLMQRAMAMGLHLDSTHFPGLPVFQSEMRARLWTTILELAVQASMDSASQAFLIPEFDTRPPSNLNDADFDTDIHLQPSPTRARPTTEATDVSVQRLIHKTFALRAKIIKALNRIPTFSYTQVIQLGTEVQAACRNVAAFFSSLPKDPSDNIAPISGRIHPNSFHKAYLVMSLRRWLLALHTPFMLQSPNNPQFYFSRKVCLEAAMAIAGYAEPLNLPSPPQDDISRLIISGRSSLKGPLSLDIISILGLEVTRQIEESSAGDVVAVGMDELASSSRTPILNVMKHILSQLLQVIGLGTPSLKRYNSLAAIMGQIRAMETGECVKRAVYETVLERLGESASLLQSVSSRGLAQSQESVGQESLSDQGPAMGDVDFDLQNADLYSGSDFNLDIHSLLGVVDWVDLEMSLPQSQF